VIEMDEYVKPWKFYPRVVWLTSIMFHRKYSILV